MNRTNMLKIQVLAMLVEAQEFSGLNITMSINSSSELKFSIHRSPLSWVYYSRSKEHNFESTIYNKIRYMNEGKYVSLNDIREIISKESMDQNSIIQRTSEGYNKQNQWRDKTGIKPAFPEGKWPKTVGVLEDDEEIMDTRDNRIFVGPMRWG